MSIHFPFYFLSLGELITFWITNLIKWENEVIMNEIEWRLLVKEKGNGSSRQ